MPSSTVDQIKERLDIVEVVSSYVKLQKAGKHFKGLSPFTKEKTPSFFVSPDRGLYHCFSTNKGGDIFTFIQEMEGVDFQGALRLLAERAGVDIVYENRAGKDKREQLYTLLEEAQKLFVKNLAGDKEVLKYLKGRGLSDTTVAIWKLGYAPPEWDSAMNTLKKRGYSDEELLATGLIKQRPEGKKGYYDVFRNRIMFPINDNAGRVIAFSGRTFPPREKGEGPKYLNTPDTELFSKSRVLYGYDKAKNAIRKNNFTILVEGQLDVLMSFQAGFPNTVAVSGTSLTTEHLKLLRRLSNNLLMSFDADQAGIASSGRSAHLALGEGMDVKVAVLPQGIDPADCIKDDPKKWKDVVRSAKHVVEFYLDVLEREESDPRKQELRAHELVLPFLAQIRNAIDQAHFVSIVASRLGAPEAAVWEELKKVEKRDIMEPVSNKAPLAAYLQPGGSRYAAIERGLIGIFLWQSELKKPHIDTQVLKEDIQKALGNEQLETYLAKENNRELIFLTELAYSTAADLKEEVQLLFNELKLEKIRSALREVTQKLKEAEAHRDESRISKLLKECDKLSKQLQQYESS